MNVNELREQFSILHGEATSLLSKAQSERRDFSADERARYDAALARCESINKAIDQQTQEAGAAFKRGDVQIGGAKPQGQIEYEREMRRFESELNAHFYGRPMRRKDSFASGLGYNPETTVSLGALLRAATVGPRNEAEHFALTRASDNTGGLNPAPATVAPVLDEVRTRSAFASAGCRLVPLDSYARRIAQVTAAPAPAIVAENGEIDATYAFSGVEFSPVKLSVIVKVPRELLEDGIDVEGEIQRELSAAMASKLDYLIGWSASSPIGIVSTSGIHEVASALNGSALTDYDRILSAKSLVESSNFGVTGVVLAPRDLYALDSLVDVNGQPVARPAGLSTVPFLTAALAPTNLTQGTESDASTLIVGDFTRLVVGMRTDLRIEVLREKYADYGQYAFAATLRFDSKVSHTDAFCKITGICPESSLS